jgi:hypothetical protein
LDIALARLLAAFNSSCFFAKRSAKVGPNMIAKPLRSSAEEIELPHKEKEEEEVEVEVEGERSDER